MVSVYFAQVALMPFSVGSQHLYLPFLSGCADAGAGAEAAGGGAESRECRDPGNGGGDWLKYGNVGTIITLMSSSQGKKQQLGAGPEHMKVHGVF